MNIQKSEYTNYTDQEKISAIETIGLMSTPTPKYKSDNFKHSNNNGTGYVYGSNAQNNHSFRNSTPYCTENNISEINRAIQYGGGASSSVKTKVERMYPEYGMPSDRSENVVKTWDYKDPLRYEDRRSFIPFVLNHQNVSPEKNRNMLFPHFLKGFQYQLDQRLETQLFSPRNIHYLHTENKKEPSLDASGSDKNDQKKLQKYRNKVKHQNIEDTYRKKYSKSNSTINNTELCGNSRIQNKLSGFRNRKKNKLDSISDKKYANKEIGWKASLGMLNSKFPNAQNVDKINNQAMERQLNESP
ncbi:hypothetical protein BB560_005505, partial [Smittium megazygosporum]